MENVRIAILDTYGKVLAFLDNTAPEALHFYDDELHTYIKGSAATYSFTRQMRSMKTRSTWQRGTSCLLFTTGRNIILPSCRRKRTNTA